MQLADKDTCAIVGIPENKKMILVYMICADHHNNMGCFFLLVLHQNQNKTQN